MDWQDMMHFRAIQQTQLSHDGSVVAFSAVPDRGESEVVVTTTDGRTTHTIERGRAPQVTPDGRWVAARLEPPFTVTARQNNRRGGPHAGLALLDTRTGNVDTVANVQRFAFSEDGNLLAYLLRSDAEDPEADTTNAENGKEDKNWKGARLVVRMMDGGQTYDIRQAGSFAWSEHAPLLAVSIAGPDSMSTELRVADFSGGAPTFTTVHSAPGHTYEQITWTGRHAAEARLAFAAGAKSDKNNQPGEVYLWGKGGLTNVDVSGNLPAGFAIPLDGSLAFDRSGDRLFVGVRPQSENNEVERDTTAAGLFSVDEILHDRTVNVWHYDDPRIHTQQRQVWRNEERATSPVIYHIAQDRAVVPENLERRFPTSVDNPRTILATDASPHFRDITHEGFFNDIYAIDLETGREQTVIERLSGGAQLSPDGRYALYFRDEAWHVFDVETGQTRNLTGGMAVGFAREEHDRPSDRPGYGIAGWVEGGHVLINDRYDVWQVALDGSSATRITNGRSDQRVFRVVNTDREQDEYRQGEAMLLRAFHDRNKDTGFYRAHAGRSGTQMLIGDDARFDFVAQARDADRLIFTRQTYTEFPDLWATGPDFRNATRITDVNPQTAEFKWGTAELIEWHDIDGIPTQGIVVKPEDFDPSRTYPVIVYYYEQYSQRLHDFNRPQINHRPAFAFYAGQDYVLFLPDINFEIGRPGYSATKSIIPGVHRLIEMGIADPDRIGLHGHSWSGYMTAFVVTQTDLFRTAIAGAPVSNMTSAYTGIRWGSGLARLFQYETGQSRLGVSMWENRQPYIDNSPVFFADRINTPLLLIHGDDDGAVPWYQSIEMYLAMRRLGKEAVFLHYRGEDHHPGTYPNRLDWALKMKEWFDHYLKDKPAAWIEEGVLYAGE
jgi:dipeptidyl aminopeptidase/acylaminoacyl peptidase